MSEWTGLGLGLGNLARLSSARTRSITAENRTGAKGGGGQAKGGMGAKAAATLSPPRWKLSPCDEVAAGATLVLADIEGPGVLQHVWMTLTGAWRSWILRVYWDDQAHPSIEVPAGDFFCCGWGEYAQVNGLPVNVNPGSGFNAFWEMPFRRRCRITLENRADEPRIAFYQVDYALTDVPPDAAYFHASFRRENPVQRGREFTVLDGVRGKGHYVGTGMCWGVQEGGWWGEGELQVFLDGDAEFPTICGTGTEDYFGGSYNFEVEGQYRAFTAPFLGMPHVGRAGAGDAAWQRFGLYRFHVMDPIRFESDIRVVIQCLGWSDDVQGYVLRADDLAATAFWYQTLPSAPLPPLPPDDALAVV